MFLDVIALIALVFALYKGIKDGFFVSVVAFLAIFIGAIGALKFSNVVKEFLFESFGWQTSFLPVIAFVLTFFFAILIAKFLANMVTKFFDAVFLGMFNRFFGALFQVLVVVLVGSMLLSFFDQMNDIFQVVEKETLEASYSYQVYLVVSDSILPSFFQLIKTLFEKSVEVLHTTTPSESV
ncbi:CvpA family protein [Myroides phaeus]|uniref:CvpA family protein n=1 Tax=Myroides phaeus TaxID=702745 RepID=UPI001303D78F|nr:CvpA family protein [Myroides phaeus]